MAHAPAAAGAGAGAGAGAVAEQDMAALKALAVKHNIRHDYILRVRQVGNYKVVLLCDDSSSMGLIVAPGPGAPPPDPFAESPATRWTELRQTCEIVVEVACTVAGGIDVHFLNHRGGALKGVRSKEQLLAGFPHKPDGSTPLARAFNDVLAANREVPGEKKPLLVLIATDGEPDGGAQGIAEFRAALAAKPDDCKVQILKVSDDDSKTAYLDKLDGDIAGLDVTDDYHTVLDRVKRYRGPETRFSFGDYLVKCLVGPFDRAMDGIDEPGGEPLPTPVDPRPLPTPVDPDQRLCAVCQDNAKEVMLQPCSHLCLCKGCTPSVIATGKCPICRTVITGSSRVFQ